MGDVFIKVGAFVTIICVGYLAGRSGRLGEGTGQALSKIVFDFTLPCAVINAFGQADFSHDLLWLMPVGVAFTVGSYFLMLLLTRRSSWRDRVFYLCNISGYSIGCFAMPFIQAFFPPSLVVAICPFDAGNAVMMSGGTYALTSVLVREADGGGSRPADGGAPAADAGTPTAGSGAPANAAQNPALLVARRLFSSVTIDVYLVLILMSLVGLRVPAGVIQFTAPMANANGFLAMFMLGMMTSLSVDASQLGKVARLLGLRLALNVAFTLLAIFVMPFDPMVRVILCMGIWAPVGAMGPVFTMWCRGDHGLAGFANAITIGVSVVAMTAIVILSGGAA